MKKQVLFTLCVTAASAALLTGCARKGEVATAQQDPTLLPAEEEFTEGSSAGVTIQPTEATPPAADQTPPPPPPAETTPRKVAPPPEQPEIYTVTKGDSISALSVRFGVRQPDILAMNPELRQNPNNLKIGQKIKFPAGTDVSKKAKPRAKTAAPAGSVVYTVKQGDVLSSIALRHGVTVPEIQSANNLKGTNIWVGQKLNIPGAKKAPKDKGPKAQDKGPKAKPQPKAEPKPQPAPQPAPAAEEQQLGEEALPPPVEGEEPPALLPPPPGVDAAPEAFTTYITKDGEDLTTVSLKWGVSLQDLRAANDLSDTASNAVPAGTTLKIPNQD